VGEYSGEPISVQQFHFRRQVFFSIQGRKFTAAIKIRFGALLSNIQSASSIF
jgi:hypothetical protein